MGGVVDHLDSKSFVPFKKRRNGYHLPGLTKEIEEQVIDEVDPELRPEEQNFVRHYLGYADVMLKNAEAEEAAERKAAEESSAPQPEAAIEPSNVMEMPKRRHADKQDGGSNAA